LIRRSLRSILCLSVVLLGILARPLHAQVPAGSVPVKTYTGFFNNTAVYFTAFETNSSNFAAANGLVYAPRLSAVNLSALPNMIFFLNAGSGQAVVLQTQPGRSNYSPLWYVLTAQWRGPGAMPLITSYSAALQWWQRGWLLIQRSGIIFNGPVIVINRPLGVLGGGNLAPTISPNDFMGINPAARTAYFTGHQGYYAGQFVTFLGLERAPGEIQDGPGSIPVPTIGLDFLGGHNAAANFYEVDGQPPVIDSAPSQAVSVASPGVYPQTSYSGSYSPIWHVHPVSFKPGVTPRLLRSVQDIQTAFNLGWVTVGNGNASDTFNCPVILGQGYQPGTGTGNPYSPGTGTDTGTGGNTGNPYSPGTGGNTGGMPPY